MSLSYHRDFIVERRCIASATLPNLPKKPVQLIKQAEIDHKRELPDLMGGQFFVNYISR